MERTSKTGWSLAALLVLLAAFWFSGAAARVIVAGLDIIVLPREASEGLELNEISYGSDTGCLPAGMDARISSAEARFCIRRALGAKSVFVPPRLIRHGLAISLRYIIENPDGTFVDFPGRILIDDAVTQPLIRVRIPRSALNGLLTASDILGRRRKRKEWALGHYEIRSIKSFDTLRVHSVPVAPGTVVTERKILAEATGRVRYKLDENLLDVRTTADVRKMSIEGTLDVRRDNPAVLVLSYRVRITDLKGDFNNVAPTLDKQISEKLRESFEKSLNKEKNRHKLARMRFPPWIPLDANVDIELVP